MRKIKKWEKKMDNYYQNGSKEKLKEDLTKVGFKVTNKDSKNKY